MAAMMTLVADRFVRDEDECVFDLATGEAVTLYERTITRARDQRERWDACVSRFEHWRAHAPPLLDAGLIGTSRWVEAYGVAADPEPGSCTPGLGIRLIVPAALCGVLAALDMDAGRNADVRRLFVKAPRGAGLTSFLGMAAREARRHGFVPVCPAAIERWPGVLAALRTRSVVLLVDRDVQHSPAFARTLVALTRADVPIAAIVAWVPDDASVPALALRPFPHPLLASRVTSSDSGDLQAEARQAEGLPGPFLARLMASYEDIHREAMEATRSLGRVADRPLDVVEWALVSDGPGEADSLAFAYDATGGQDAARGDAQDWGDGPAWNKAALAASIATLEDAPSEAPSASACASAPKQSPRAAGTGTRRARSVRARRSTASDRPTLRVVPPRPAARRAAAPDVRVDGPWPGAMLSGYGAYLDGLVVRSRWEQATRVMSTRMAMHDRRGNPLAAARMAIDLGRLHLSRGQVEDAARCFDQAGERSASAGETGLMADSLHWSGLAALDNADLERSERLLRTAHAAAAPIGDANRIVTIELSLARCLFWQGRVQDIPGALFDEPRKADDEGHRLVEIARSRRGARLAIAGGDLKRAAEAIGHACRLGRAELNSLGDGSARLPAGAARESADRACDPRSWGMLGPSAPAADPPPSRRSPGGRVSVTRRVPGWEADIRTACLLEAARLQLAIDDPEGCDLHLREAFMFPRAPARTMRLQIVQLERLRRAHGESVRDRIVRLGATLCQPHVPVLVRVRARYWVEKPSRRAAELSAFLERYGETALVGQHGQRSESPLLDAFRAILQACQETPDDLTALAHVSAFLRERLQAACVAVHAVPAARGPLAVAGTIRLASPEVAARAIDAGLMLPPARRADAIEAAAPIRYAGQTIGAIAAHWIIDARIDRAVTSALLGTAAAAIAPHVRAIMDRDPRALSTVLTTAAGPEGPTPPGRPPDGQRSDGKDAVTAPDARPTRVDVRSARTLGLLGISTTIEELRAAILRVASSSFPVLIEGESGSGKELVARALHQHGQRRHRRFCAINCAALTEDLLEAELFGHARGAFTGALSERPGLFEEADGGTLFLDEIGEMSARGQAKLLRVLQEGETRRVGENLPRRVDTRIVAATNRALRREAAAGTFRADLLYRLDVIRIAVPPLRERPEDIAVLARAFWQEALSRTGSRATLDPDTLAALARYHWPGNVRQLHNAIMALAVHAPVRGRVGPSALRALWRAGGEPVADTPSKTDHRAADDRGANDGSADEEILPLVTARRLFEARHVRRALARAGGQLTRAAIELGCSRQGLHKLMQRLDIASFNDPIAPDGVPATPDRDRHKGSAR